MALTYKALAVLLAYPAAAIQDLARPALQAIEDEGMVPAQIRRSLARLADELAEGDLFDLQERYVWQFDRTRSLSLNLYEHVHGESRDRGQAMVALLELYRSKGVELSANELPDNLPVFLEFLSLLPEPEAASLLGEAAHVLAVEVELAAGEVRRLAREQKQHHRHLFGDRSRAVLRIGVRQKTECFGTAHVRLGGRIGFGGLGDEHPGPLHHRGVGSGHVH